jgi:truncated hemoglobin YjbI
VIKSPSRSSPSSSEGPEPTPPLGAAAPRRLAASPLGARIGDRRVLAPHPELWAALEGGLRLRRILEAFYARVYADPRLLPFFARTTIEWAVDHQYAFLAQIFSGTKMFFGDRPRNAHHAMVISDELFDYREALMMQTLEEHGLSAAQRDEWRAVEEAFRSHIVKAAPWAKKRRGVALPLGGFRPLQLSCGCLCDQCGAELAAGAAAEYSVESGRLYCGGCAVQAKAAELARGAGLREAPAPDEEDDEDAEDDERDGDEAGARAAGDGALPGALAAAAGGAA